MELLAVKYLSEHPQKRASSESKDSQGCRGSSGGPEQAHRYNARHMRKASGGVTKARSRPHGSVGVAGDCRHCVKKQGSAEKRADRKKKSAEVQK